MHGYTDYRLFVYVLKLFSNIYNIHKLGLGLHF